ncbi:radical SAM protein [archaeon]|nr:radical SAM protein [archaeon]MBL7057361.1 radical SAM protein [Candidatus Woesearchaeota archaeon]
MKKKYFEELETNLAYHFGKVLNKPLVKPHWVFISLLHKCNLKCQMCGVSKILKEHELTFKEVKKIIDEVASWKSDSRIQLTGGEVLLRNDIFDIVNYSTSKNLVTELVSNGMILNQEKAEKIISSDLWGMAISLDGATAKTHDDIRGVKGSFDKAVNALKLLVKEKKSRKKGPQISIWTTVMNNNVEELEKIAHLAKKVGVDCLVYHPVVLSQTDMQSTKQEGGLWIPKSKISILKEQTKKLIEFKEKYGIIEFTHNPTLFAKYFDKTLRKQEWTCNPLEFIDIGPNGAVQSCGGDFGSIKHLSLAESLNTKKAEESRELMKRCEKPCLQTCWARPDAEDLNEIFKTFFTKLNQDKIRKEEKKKLLKQSLILLNNYESMLKKAK